MLSKGFLELARKLVAANTVSSEGTRQAADLLQTLWERAGLAVRRQVVDGVHVNLAGGPGGGAAGAGGVLLVTHLDTVPPGPLDKWQTDPWTLTERDGFLSGLGCADVKLDALCKAEAARRLQGHKTRRPFWLLGTFGEEVGLRGARHFVASELFRQIAPSADHLRPQGVCGRTLRHPRPQGAYGRQRRSGNRAARVLRKGCSQLDSASRRERHPQGARLGEVVRVAGRRRARWLGDQRRSCELPARSARAARKRSAGTRRNPLPAAASAAAEPLARAGHCVRPGGAVAAQPAVGE